MSVDIEKLIQDDLESRVNKTLRERSLREYYNNPNYCKCCGKVIVVSKTESPRETRRKNFCNSSCAASYNNKQKEKKHNYCLNCGSEISLENKYCSNVCQHAYLQREREEEWLSGNADGNTKSEWTEVRQTIRGYLFKKYDNKCSRCGWGETNPYTGTIPLEVEHIDGNPYNSSPENLTLLCPNCHSMTRTYRGANRGHGRSKTWTPKKLETNM